MGIKELMTPKPARIVKVVDEALNVKTYYIELPRGFERPKPGQFNMIYIPGVGEIPISVSDIENGVVGHTVRFVGSVTYVLKNLGVGDIVGIRGPYGKPWPLNDYVGKDILIVAGGIGLAPLRSVIKEILRNRGKFGKLTLLYGARTPKDLLYKHELGSYCNAPNTEILLTVDRADETWRGHVGVVTKLIPKAKIDPERTVAFVCGPEIMMRFTVIELAKVGLKPNQIYLSLERRMRCGVGLCGHCQMGPYFVCKHGPIFPYWFIKKYFEVEEI
ncbi:MAG: Ni/Fe hydrogenase subunit gamma [Thermoprotei archaeon]|nr:MAG: Ni/Fe hydrogenase subunit gamma [Thermoprotei archaeon]